MKVEIVNDKLKICDLCYPYRKEIKHYFNDKKELLGTKTIYYLGNIKNSMVAKTLFEKCYVKIDDKIFYCPNDLKFNNDIDYFMEDVKLIEC